jgi:hypothetical protein
MGEALRAAGKPSAISMKAEERRWEVSLARLERATPAQHDPVAAKSRTAGRQITGTVVSIRTGDGIAVVDVQPGSVHRHNVRNVLTYAASAEATFGVINEGDNVYYDRSSIMPANVYLSTSPLDSAGVANALYGHVVLDAEETSDSFPKAATTARSLGCAVMQTGSGNT